LTFGFWSGSSSRSKRIITIIACFLFITVLSIAGTLTPISAKYSKDTNNQLNQEHSSIENGGVLGGALLIFENNFLIDLVMFIPVAGPIFGSYVIYNTGRGINAESNSPNNTSHVPATVLLFLLFVFPDTWLEFIAYSTALAASIWLTWGILQGRGRHEITRTAEFIAICAGLLLLGAFIEAYIIIVLGL
jgi:uncharacterized membrane protein SpoIIM required for sporulation